MYRQANIHDYLDDKAPLDWVEVAALGIYDYQWDELKVFYSPSARRLYWYADSGCSCFDWGDDLRSVSDFEDGDKEAALRAVKEYIKTRTQTESWYTESLTGGDEALRAIREFDPSNI